MGDMWETSSSNRSTVRGRGGEGEGERGGRGGCIYSYIMLTTPDHTRKLNISC